MLLELFYWRCAQPGIPKISETTAAQVFKGDIGMRAAKKEPLGLMQVLGLEVINHPEAVQLCRERSSSPSWASASAATVFPSKHGRRI